MTVPHILLVEDNEVEQFALKLLIARFDYEAYVVSSGEEAMDVLREGRYAAIIMDIKLPGMDGYECARLIRETELNSNQRTPIIAVTGKSEAQDRYLCLAAGMDDYLSKPFDPQDLRKILLRWVYQPSRPNLKLLQPFEEASPE